MLRFGVILMVKFLGFFYKLHDPSRAIRSACGTESDNNKAVILNYIRNGSAIMFCPGLEMDYLSAKRKIIGPSTILWDGEWCWTSDTSYYIDKYNFAIPMDFQSKIIEFKGVPPGVQKSAELLSSLESSFTPDWPRDFP